VHGAEYRLQCAGNDGGKVEISQIKINRRHSFRSDPRNYISQYNVLVCSVSCSQKIDVDAALSGRPYDADAECLP
jgi:hypothetical protein